MMGIDLHGRAHSCPAVATECRVRLRWLGMRRAGRPVHWLWRKHLQRRCPIHRIWATPTACIASVPRNADDLLLGAEGGMMHNRHGVLDCRFCVGASTHQMLIVREW